MVFLIVAVMFIAFIAISYWKSRKSPQPQQAELVKEKKPEKPVTYFHPGHTFARIVGDNLVEVGIDDFARHAFGTIDNIDLPEKGRLIKQGEVAWRIKVGDKKVKQPMPVSGTVIELNEKKDGPWLLKVKALSLKAGLANLLTENIGKTWMESVKTRFQADFSSSAVAAMQDGGELIEGFARNLTDDQWKEFCKSYLNCA